MCPVVVERPYKYMQMIRKKFTRERTPSVPRRCNDNLVFNAESYRPYFCGDTAPGARRRCIVVELIGLLTFDRWRHGVTKA